MLPTLVLVGRPNVGKSTLFNRLTGLRQKVANYPGVTVEKKIGRARLRSGRAVRHTHDYRRHGVLDLYAAVEVATGRVTHQVSPTHTAADFRRFMKRVVRAYPDRDVHVVLDNSSTHNTAEVRAWLAAHPRVHFPYTPTSASWLNQIELWFGIVSRRVLRHASFRTADELVSAIESFIDTWNREEAHPFRWTYDGIPLVR